MKLIIVLIVACLILEATARNDAVILIVDKEPFTGVVAVVCGTLELSEDVCVMPGIVGLLIENGWKTSPFFRWKNAKAGKQINKNGGTKRRVFESLKQLIRLTRQYHGLQTNSYRRGSTEPTRRSALTSITIGK
uniref:Uncharacterized protein n=1 Tax=Magallana gigas TaxID=29159 RepID=K1PYH6_MAGGI